MAKHLKGIGLTMEGIDNNPVMFELMTELPWRPDKFTKEEWLKGYLSARYGK
uniref:NAGLU n=1 Tax=uncultured Prevotella sp. TaxID=159272 RepID=A0A060BX70_9BACT|nr:NAGLU [uncultured Prevotella sp.]